jgi:hypothetical protein
VTLISAKDAQGKEACPDVLLMAGVIGMTYDVSGFLHEHAIAISQIDNSPSLSPNLTLVDIIKDLTWLPFTRLG